MTTAARAILLLETLRRRRRRRAVDRTKHVKVAEPRIKQESERSAKQASDEPRKRLNKTRHRPTPPGKRQEQPPANESVLTPSRIDGQTNLRGVRYFVFFVTRIFVEHCFSLEQQCLENFAIGIFGKIFFSSAETSGDFKSENFRAH